MPISLRQEGDTTANNQVAGTLIDLGTEIADPAARLKAIKRGTAAMKKEMGTFRGVIPTDFPSLGSPWLISGLASLYGRSRIADWLRLTNVTISNVPGSRVPVYLCGARMTDYYPLSIVVHGIALNITVQSHVDQLCFGLIACRRAVHAAVRDGHLVPRHTFWQLSVARASRRKGMPVSLIQHDDIAVLAPGTSALHREPSKAGRSA